jgi:O-methyltransferase involved in polyketide biosynthesis
MRKRQASLTAAGIAVVRAIESERPADERICYDPFARRFVPAWMYQVFGFFYESGLHRVARSAGCVAIVL